MVSAGSLSISSLHASNCCEPDSCDTGMISVPRSIGKAGCEDGLPRKLTENPPWNWMISWGKQQFFHVYGSYM